MVITDPTGHTVPDPSNTGAHDPPDDDDANQAAEDLALLVELVAEMRNRQREYFRTRNGAALSASKRAEKAVDDILAEITKGETQKRLF